MSTCHNVVLYVVFMILFSVPSSAFNVTTDFSNGAYWGTLPVQMKKFATSNIEDPLLSLLVANAIETWESSVGTELIDLADNYVLVDEGNTIRWSYQFAAETGYDEQSTLAITIRYRSSALLDRAIIILNGNNAFLRANQGNMLFQTILHDLDHVLGLGHSEYSQAVMAANLSGADDLDQDDIAGINYVVDQTHERQARGISSNFLNDDESDALEVANCGSVNYSGGPGSGNGAGLTLLSLLLGFLAVSLGRAKMISLKI